MGSRRVGGILEVKIDGQQVLAKGEFTLNIGIEKREAIVGVDKVHGFSEIPQAPTASGSITIPEGFDVESLLRLTDATVTFSLANSQTAVYRDAFFTADGNLTTNEGELEFELKAISAEYVR